MVGGQGIDTGSDVEGNEFSFFSFPVVFWFFSFVQAVEQGTWPLAAIASHCTAAISPSDRLVLPNSAVILQGGDRGRTQAAMCGLGPRQGTLLRITSPVVCCIFFEELHNYCALHFVHCTCTL